MIVKNIKLINYRNFSKVNVKLNNNLNIFIGDNAQGKTNLLESIYISSIGRTFRSNKENDLIKFDENFSQVEVSIIKKNLDKKINIKLKKNSKKSIEINQIKLEKNNDLIGILNNVIFTPDDLKLIKGSPSERRRLINIAISQIKPKYKYLLKNYKKVITQRNNLLRKVNDENIDVLNIWNNYLINIGSEIIRYREKYFKKLKYNTEKIYSNISGNNEMLTLEYKSLLGDINNIPINELKELFNLKLSKNFQNEKFRGLSLVGPHRDDIIIKIDNKECKYFGSQGQQRTAALSLKLAEIEIIHEEIGEYPILLLDDVLSELDNNRKKYLMNYIQKLQTIITSVNDEDLQQLIKLKDKKVFYIKNGIIENINK